VKPCAPIALALLLASGCASSGAHDAWEAGPDAGDAGSTRSPDAISSVDAHVQVEDGGAFVAVPLTACNPNVYAAQVTIGGSQTFELLLDTGSTTLAVASAGCTSCSAAGVSMLYRPGSSAVDQRMTGASGFGSGSQVSSSWSGEIDSDIVSLGSPAAQTRMDFVAIGEQQQFLVGTCGSAPPQGVVGLAPRAIAVHGTDGLLDRLVMDGVVSDLFAVRMCGSGGALWLGGYDASALSYPPVYTPMQDIQVNGQSVQAWYTVNLASIAVLGTTVIVPTGAFTEAMLDTGSSNSSLPPDAFSALVSAIGASPSFSAMIGMSAGSFFADPNHCTMGSQSKDALDAALPPLTLTFGSSVAVSIQASATESYLMPNGAGGWCPAFVSLAPDASAYPEIAAHLGAPILRSQIVIFDRAHHRVGFASHAACP
jgi:hypothetical protein